MDLKLILTEAYNYCVLTTKIFLKILKYILKIRAFAFLRRHQGLNVIQRRGGVCRYSERDQP